MIPADTVKGALEAMPAWLSDGMQIGGGMVVAVGYAMVINMMASREVLAILLPLVLLLLQLAN